MNKLKKSKDQTSFSYKMIAGMVCIALAAICVLGIASLLGGCKAKALPMYPFVTEPLEKFDTVEEAVDTLIYTCTVQVEALASTMSAFPTYFGESEIFASSEPDYLDDRMDDEDGFSVYFALSMCLLDVLDEAECMLGTWSGEAQVLFMTERVKNPSGKQDYGLAWDTVMLEDEQVLVIAQEVGGQKNFAYFLVSGGFQRIIPVSGAPELANEPPISDDLEKTPKPEPAKPTEPIEPTEPLEPEINTSSAL